jgi:hypothetical protein
MNTKQNEARSQTNPIRRSDFLHLLEIALNAKAYRFLQQATINWLAVFPGDLTVQRFQGIAFAKNGRSPQAIDLLKKICALDPEDNESLTILLNLMTERGDKDVNEVAGNLYALGSYPDVDFVLPGWALKLKALNDAFTNKEYQQVEKSLPDILTEASNSVLAGLLHLKIIMQKNDPLTLRQLAEIYHDRWPESIQFRLILADSLVKLGMKMEGTSLLHECVHYDTAGQIVQRLFGAETNYQSLWPKNLEVRLDIPIPADINGLLGWNKLGGGVATTRKANEVEQQLLEDTPGDENIIVGMKVDDPNPETSATFFDVRAGAGQMLEGKGTKKKQSRKPKKDQIPTSDPSDYERLAMKLQKGNIPHGNSRFPMYVILSSHQNLIHFYGEKSTEVMENEMEQLADAVSKHPGWGSLVLLPDLKTNVEKYNIECLQQVDPWKVKLALADLDKALAKKGEMIGALLIVGGDEIIPFHRLPNPVSDGDTEVLSDNPYSNTDNNYFIQEWPIGRLPGEPGPDAGLLLSQLHRIFKMHEKNNQRTNIKSFVSIFSPERIGSLTGWGRGRSFGYTAAIWRRSSLAAFHPIGEGKDLNVSPPFMSGIVEARKLSVAPLAYYNLHGLIDAPEWFGQKDPSEKRGSLDYPVALSHLDVEKFTTMPKVILSEACYGAHTIGKTDQTSLALKFISLGVMAFVGSTCISYGSIAAPLIGGDLLSNLFWKFLKEGQTSGEALMHAKIEVAREMNRRQGYLDGEDQKTLLSFVLYGDPLFQKKKMNARSKLLIRENGQAAYITVTPYDFVEDDQARSRSGEIIANAKQILSSYLPGLENAEVQLAKERYRQSGKPLAGNQATTQAHVAKLTNRTVVTFSKNIQMNSKTATQYARMTLNPDGKMVKLAVSR